MLRNSVMLYSDYTSLPELQIRGYYPNQNPIPYLDSDTFLSYYDASSTTTTVSPLATSTTGPLNVDAKSPMLVVGGL